MRSLLASILLTFGFCTTALAATPTIVLSVDWEGRDLQDKNLKAIIDFRTEFPDAHLVHFLNAAYFTKPGVDADEVARKIRSVLKPGDELGVHIHGWHTFFAAAGVPHREVGHFWPTADLSGPDHGHDEIIEDYSVEDLRKVLNYSRRILESHGFHGLRTFRAGGWMGGPNIREALVREGFEADSSAVATSHLQSSLGRTPLFARLTELWPAIGPHSQPFTIQTAAGPLKEFPNNSGLADYVIADDFVKIFKSLSAKKNADGLVVHYGFHQETAARYLHRVSEGLRLAQRSTWWNRRSLEFATLETLRTSSRSCESVF